VSKQSSLLVLGDLVRIIPVNKKDASYKVLIYLGDHHDKTKVRAFKWCKVWHPQSSIELWPKMLVKKLDIL
jgi:hypothetical protein